MAVYTVRIVYTVTSVMHIVMYILYILYIVMYLHSNVYTVAVYTVTSMLFFSMLKILCVSTTRHIILYYELTVALVTRCLSLFTINFYILQA